ncbi:nucleotidyl transferase AbiEii/AbiGii toxin family protein [candidate division WOR-3 bacterium]|nr:nucleotidyl transferase AbiEii/AbiGii toxin family protein [candidate division WOR-3 bacterium]
MAAEYPKREVAACRAVMVELFTILGEYRDRIALVGGWVPTFLAPEDADRHTGSLDVDIAVDTSRIDDDAYRTLREELTRHGYEQGDQPFRFFRTVPAPGGEPVRVEVDFLTGEYGGTAGSHRTQPVQDLRARKARGCDLVFDHTVVVRLTGRMPCGERNEVRVRIAGPVPFIVMKGMALYGRKNEKDAYDIYWLVRHYPGGIDALAAAFGPASGNSLVLEGLGKVRGKFRAPGAIGPVWAARFSSDDAEEQARIARDAYERVNALLDRLHIEPFPD